jgi:hypothetical protein
MKTYKIIRFFRNGTVSSQVVETGLSLEEAQEHCNNSETSKADWFDGYEEEK